MSNNGFKMLYPCSELLSLLIFFHNFYILDLTTPLVLVPAARIP